MSQQEKLIALLKEMGVPFEQNSGGQRTTIVLTAERGSAVVDGYTGMFCQFAFDGNGRFKDALIAE